MTSKGMSFFNALEEEAAVTEKGRLLSAALQPSL